MVLKGKTSPPQSKTSTDDLSGTTNGVKKSNWADSDDDEDFTASFNSLDRVKELEKTRSAKDAVITELTVTGREKDARIIKLESALECQKQSLPALQTAADASTAQVEGLQHENYKQLLHVQKLVAEVDEKDRRIAALETEVDEQSAKIAELDAVDRSTQASSHDTAPATEAATTSKAAGPAANLSVFPVFATPTTVKHMAPPPPAPKLKMTVDLSNSAKKPAAKTVTPKKKVEITSTDAAKDGPAPTIDP
ncbi:hypothetical protein N0V91_008923 [Didymella pomorum]|uniref:Uncharacterized protein n=1 Tax=Didymella pomorum TaxID=749634 RepID=A0A9W9D3I8_9PLEO|nr:hypothetical protein N0V91_008923 [Didymella pomorum]